MKLLVTLVTLLALSSSALAQNCSRTSTGFPPINDLGKGYYRGYQGGLYPNGENYAPDKHLAEGLRRSLVMRSIASLAGIVHRVVLCHPG